MADNVTLNAGSGGATIATDDDGTAQHQYVKVEFGGDGTFTKVSTSNPLPVDIRAENASVTVDGTVTANLGATDNAVLDAIAASVAGTLTVDGSGVTQPVSGTVTANLGATDNAVLDDIAAKLAPNATNGVTPYLNQDTSAIASVKGSAGTLYWIVAMSTDATPVYLNLYDSTTAILGTTTPTLQFIIPSQGDANGAGFSINFGPLGVQFATGIQVAAATAFDGSTDPGTNVVFTNIGYE